MLPENVLLINSPRFYQVCVITSQGTSRRVILGCTRIFSAQLAPNGLSAQIKYTKVQWCPLSVFVFIYQWRPAIYLSYIKILLKDQFPDHRPSSAENLNGCMERHERWRTNLFLSPNWPAGSFHCLSWILWQRQETPKTSAAISLRPQGKLSFP